MVDGFNKINVRSYSAHPLPVHNANRTFAVDGNPHHFTLPSTLAPGGYLLRHEIIALHLADQPGGAEFYPACIQINVGGDQTGAPSPDELVKFPGAYSDNDPGILVNAFDDAPYDFPGPPISNLASSSPSNGDPDSPSSFPIPSSSTGKTSTPARPSPSGPPLSSPSSYSGYGRTSTPALPSSSALPPNDGSGDCNSKRKRKRLVYDDSDRSYIPSIPGRVPESVRDWKPHRLSRVMVRLTKPHRH